MGLIMKSSIHSEELIHSKIESADRINHQLVIDCQYSSPSLYKNFKDDVISKLMGVGIQGGIRFIGSRSIPLYVVLFTTGEDLYWRDFIDEELGVLVYYGDNKKPGNDLHKTKPGGNEVLRESYKFAGSEDIDVRRKIPPFFVFKKEGTGRDVKFLGLAIPGINEKDQKDWLTAVWGNRDGERFLNYKAYFTILDTKSGSEYSKSPGINLAWLNDIVDGKAYESKHAPLSWKTYIQKGKFTPLLAKKERLYRISAEQLPSLNNDKKLLKYLHDFFIEIDGGYSFEKFAIDTVRGIDESIIEISRTQPYKDGGFDGYGTYRIFSSNESSMIVDFFLEAKCYGIKNPVGVKQTSRLISRIKNRQFGIIFTTSFVATQAYMEILEDQHPIVIIAGGDIIDYLKKVKNVTSLQQLEKWLSNNYKVGGNSTLENS